LTGLNDEDGDPDSVFTWIFARELLLSGVSLVEGVRELPPCDPGNMAAKAGSSMKPLRRRNLCCVKRFVAMTAPPT